MELNNVLPMKENIHFQYRTRSVHIVVLLPSRKLRFSSSASGVVGDRT